MGWLFSNRWGSKDELVRFLRSPERNGPHYEVLASTVRGSRHWYVARYTKDDKVVTFIGLDLMESGGNEGWGYKDMDESVGPYYYDCPLRFLDMVAGSEPVGYAEKWRESVREWHAKKAARPEWVAGMVVKYGAANYRLDAPAGPRRGWSVTDVATGVRYRMTAPQLAKCEPVVEENAMEVAQ